MEVIVILIKLTGIFILEAVLIVVFHIYTYKLKLPSVELICKPDVPDYIKKYLSECSKRIEKLNFTFSHYIKSEGLISNMDSKNWGIVLLNRVKNTYSIIKINDLHNNSTTYSTEFITYFADGTSLLTLNDSKHFLIGSLPDTIINDPYAITLEQQWYSHINILDKMKNIVPPVIPSENVRVLLDNEKLIKYFNSLIHNNLTKSNNNLYRFRFIPSVIYSFKLLKGLGKHIYLKRKKSYLPKEYVDISNEFVIEKYKVLFSNGKSGKKFFNKTSSWVIIYLVIILVIFFPINYVISGLAIFLLFKFGHYLENILFGDAS